MRHSYVELRVISFQWYFSVVRRESRHVYICVLWKFEVQADVFPLLFLNSASINFVGRTSDESNMFRCTSQGAVDIRREELSDLPGAPAAEAL